MKNPEELLNTYNQISSETIFLKKEIEFLLKILRNCYSSSSNLEKIKLLDSYWKGFEKNIAELELVLQNTNQNENSLAYSYQNGMIEYNTYDFTNNPLIKKYKDIEKEVKLLKESFYEYMHGCNACSFKTT